jgi:hypothetical protein
MTKRIFFKNLNLLYFSVALEACVRGRGAEFISGYLDRGLHFNSPSKRRGGGG